MQLLASPGAAHNLMKLDHQQQNFDRWADRRSLRPPQDALGLAKSADADRDL